MMYQKKSNPWARLKYAYVLPLAATTVAIFAQPEISIPFDEISNAKVSHFSLETSKNEVKNLPEVDIPAIFEFPSAVEQSREDSIYVKCDLFPQFPGGELGLLNWIKEKIRIPEDVSKNGIERRVTCRFVVEKDGSISNVEVVRGQTKSMDEEAIRVVKTLPKFEKPGMNKGQPVRVRFSVPVLFRLQGVDSNAKPQSSSGTDNISVTTFDDDQIFVTVENHPLFPGGEAALLKWISEYMIYPKEAAENGIQGRVTCQFVVEKDGSVSNVEVVRSVNKLLDEEAIRVLKTLPKFKPGTQRGQTVRVRYSVPVHFRLQSVDSNAKPQSSTDTDNISVTTFDDDQIFVTVENHPLFPGGEAALLKWISEYMIYPKEASENGIQGRVTCQFVVEKDGSVSNVEVVRSVNKLLDEEAIRVLKTLPKFRPGTQRGKTVRVLYSVPVNFKLSQ